MSERRFSREISPAEFAGRLEELRAVGGLEVEFSLRRGPTPEECEEIGRRARAHSSVFVVDGRRSGRLFTHDREYAAAMRVVLAELGLLELVLS